MPTISAAPNATRLRAIRLHLIGDRDSVTVCVRATTTTTWGDIGRTLRARGINVPEPVYAGSELLREHTRLGQHPLLNGVQLAPSPTSEPPRHLLDLVATEGPAVGARAALGAATQRVGRAPQNTLILRDPGLSRVHLTVAVDHGRAVVTDARSTNGTHLDGRPLQPDSAHELRVGQRLRAGSSTLALERALPVPDASATDESCRIPFQRAARTAPGVRPTTLQRPVAPADPAPRRMPWPLVVLPMLVAAGLALLLHNSMFLMFAVLGPVMMLGQHVADRQGAARQTKQQRREHVAALDLLCSQRAAAVDAELLTRRRLTPPISDTVRAAMSRNGRLWERSPSHEDYLLCRVGTGTVPSRVLTTGGAAPDEVALLMDAPIVVDLAASRVIGVTGAQLPRRRMAQGLMLQLATWQSPRFLRMLVLCDTAATRAHWDWAVDLPHITAHPHATSTIADLETGESLCLAMLSGVTTDDDEREPMLDRDRPTVSTVVILDGCAQWSRRREVTALLAHTEDSGVAVVAVGGAADLPAECATTVDVISSTTVIVCGSVDVHGRPDLPEPTLAPAVATHLARIRDATPEADSGTVPDRADLVDVWRTAGCEPTDADSIGRRWQLTDGSTVAPLGVTAAGTVRVDLATDGPHGLIAGITGAGKSELLQSLVTSLALANRPDQLIFVLVDYKGGAAFRECARLPHTVGLVTDLDAHLTRRALTSLRAEVRRREKLFVAVGATDLMQYRRSPHAAPLPRLVLVIDEFRVLAEEMPDFLAGLVRLAAVGRSLGIHLLLATQRPAGVVSADMRANINLRIALRVRDEADSQDVIESGAAARISSATPGRGIVRTGGGRPIAFQAARVGGCTEAGESIEVATLGIPAPPVPATVTPGLRGPTDLRRTVDAICDASARLAVQVPPSPWPAPLPALVTIAELDGSAVSISGTPCTADAVPLGIVDLPEDQAVRPLAWDPAVDGHLAVIGGPRSGRSSALRTIALQAACRWPNDGLAIYVLDTGAALRALGNLPQCGAVVDRDDVQLADRVVQWISGEIRSRQDEFADADVAGFADHLRCGGTLARILVLVDGWESLTQISEDATLGRLTEELVQVLRDGPAAGVYAAVTGGRALGTGRVAGAFSSRLVLDLSDRSDTVLLGLRQSDLPEEMPPGRAVTCPGGLELQIATPTADVSGPGLAHHVAVTGRPMRAPQVHRFAPMPQTCRRRDLPRDESQVILGVGGPHVQPVGLPYGGFGELAALLAGPAHSGRTTALLTVAHQLHGRAVCWIDGRGHPPRLPSTVTVLEATAPEALANWIAAHPTGAVLVDDVDELLGSPIDDLVGAHLHHGRRRGAIVCCAGRADALANAYRGAVAELRQRQTGLLLRPGRRDGELLGATLGPQGHSGPGRGVLVVRARAVPVQVAA